MEQLLYLAALLTSFAGETICFMQLIFLLLLFTFLLLYRDPIFSTHVTANHRVIVANHMCNHGFQFQFQFSYSARPSSVTIDTDSSAGFVTMLSLLHVDKNTKLEWFNCLLPLQ